MSALDDMLTPTETALVCGVSVRDVHRVIDEGLLPDSFYNAAQPRSFKSRACVFISFYFRTADRLTSKERQRMIAIASKKIDGREGETVIRDDFLTIDFASFSSGVDKRLHRLYAARKIVVSDPEILSGTPVIKGTRVPVYDIATSVAAGIPMGRILSSYPSLKCEQVELATLFAEANPSRGRPRQQTTVPSWTTVVTKRRKLSTKPV
jgi:uncharacterized protein (DUF433 family)